MTWAWVDAIGYEWVADRNSAKYSAMYATKTKNIEPKILWVPRLGNDLHELNVDALCATVLQIT